MSRVIARSGLARHFGNIALISDDAVILLLSNLYTESVQKGWREPNHISFALWTLFGERVSHPPSLLELSKTYGKQTGEIGMPQTGIVFNGSGSTILLTDWASE